MKIKSVRASQRAHTWDISVPGEQYLLPNGVVSHNTSAQIANATNGIEPPRALVSVKASKDGSLPQVVPEFKKLKKQYDLLWDQRSPIGYLNICAVLQKYIDQAISVNTSYNPDFYENHEIPMSDLLSHILHHYRYGGKTLYYLNTNVQQVDVSKIVQSESVIEDDADCDSCKI